MHTLIGIMYHTNWIFCPTYVYSQIHVLKTMVVVSRSVLLVGPACVPMATLWTLMGNDATVCLMFRVPGEALNAISTF